MFRHHPGIDPLPVRVVTARDAEGAPTAHDARPHCNVTAAFLAANPDLGPFRVRPTPYARVFAGDDPFDPQWTVALRFPGEAALRASPLQAWLASPPPA